MCSNVAGALKIIIEAAFRDDNIDHSLQKDTEFLTAKRAVVSHSPAWFAEWVIVFLRNSVVLAIFLSFLKKTEDKDTSGENEYKEFQSVTSLTTAYYTYSSAAISFFSPLYHFFCVCCRICSYLIRARFSIQRS